jgi:hypothetical protein
MVKAEAEKAQLREAEEEKAREQQRTAVAARSSKRKADLPRANRRNFEEENVRMGVGNELDLLIGEDQAK